MPARPVFSREQERLNVAIRAVVAGRAQLALRRARGELRYFRALCRRRAARARREAGKRS